jgi:hypothetical protein
MLRQNKDASFSGLKGTYLPILKQIVGNDNEDPEKDRLHQFKRVVGAIILLYDPLSTSALAHLLGIQAGDVGRVLRPLHSVLNIPRAAGGRTDRMLPITSFTYRFGTFFWVPVRKATTSSGSNQTRDMVH